MMDQPSNPRNDRCDVLKQYYEAHKAVPLATIKFTSRHDHIHQTDRRSVEFSVFVKRRLIDSREGARFREAVVIRSEEVIHLDAALVRISGADQRDFVVFVFVGHGLVRLKSSDETRAFHCEIKHTNTMTS